MSYFSWKVATVESIVTCKLSHEMSYFSWKVATVESIVTCKLSHEMSYFSWKVATVESIVTCKGPFKCYVTLFFWKFDPHPPRNANSIEYYTFVTLFSRKSDTPHPHLRYVTLEWPLSYHTRCHTSHGRSQRLNLL